MAITMSADEIATKWSTNLGASTSRIEAGVNAVSTAPGLAAARASDRYLMGVQNSVPKYKARVQAVTLSEWQDATKTKGIPRIAPGAQAAIPKATAFWTKAIPFINSVVSGLPERGNLEQNIARSAAMIRGMAKFKNA